MARTADWTGKEPFHSIPKPIPITSREQPEIKKILALNLVNVPVDRKMKSLEWEVEECKKSKQERPVAQQYRAFQQQLDMGEVAEQVEKMQKDFYNYQKMTDEQLKEKETVQLKLSAKIEELEKEKKVLMKTVKELEMEIEKQKGQHTQEDSKGKQGESELTPKEERQCGRYADALKLVNVRFASGEEAKLLLVEQDINAESNDSVTCLGLTVHAGVADRVARGSKNFTTFVYAMCSRVFNKSYAVYFSFEGSTRSILETLKLPEQYANGFTQIVAQIGMDHGLQLPDGTKPVRTKGEHLVLRCGIAKKILNGWLSKLRGKYRPKRKDDEETKKPVVRKVKPE